MRRQCVILGAPGYRAVTTDLEARLSETGVAQAQVTDYRNFAHGRHLGVSRNLDDATVIALVAPPHQALAEATLERLPPGLDVVRLESSLPWPFSTLDLLVGSMYLVGAAASAQALDPGRPKVPSFGRELYNLPSRGLVEQGATGPVARKLAALRMSPSDDVADAYARALADWHELTSVARFSGVVLDYDGTVCTTAGRFDLPEPIVQQRLLRLLDAGAIIGFATGRGSSLHRDLRRGCLRSTVGRSCWPVHGGLHLGLDEPAPRREPAVGALADLARQLREGPMGLLLTVEERAQQTRCAAPSWVRAEHGSHRAARPGAGRADGGGQDEGRGFRALCRRPAARREQADGP